MLGRLKRWARRLFTAFDAHLWAERRYRFKIAPWLAAMDADELRSLFDAVYPQRHLQPVRQLPVGKRIVILAPHPDDEVLGAFGLLGAKDSEVHVFYLTSGLPGEQTLREQEANAVCKQVQVQPHFFRVDLNGGEDALRPVTEMIVGFRPDILALPFILDDHPDHLASNKIIGFLPAEFSVDIWAYQVYTSMLANVFIDLTSMIDDKGVLMAMYRSQIEGFDWAHFIRGLNAWNARFANDALIRYAENYFVLPITDYRMLCMAQMNTVEEMCRNVD